MEPILVIMAAGMGSRYGGNKQIDAVTDEGDIIMDFSLYDAYLAGFRRAVFIIKEDFGEIFRAHIDGRAGKLYETYFVTQRLDDVPEGFEVPENRCKPWGTGHAVLAARDVIDAPFAVINADDYYGKESFKEVFDFLSNEADSSHHCVVGFRVENTLSENGTVTRGVCNDYDGLLADIEEHFEVGYETDGEYAGEITGVDTSGVRHVIEEGTPVSMNLWGLGRQFVQSLEEQFGTVLADIIENNPEKGEFYLPSSIDSDIKAGKATVKLLMSDDKWFGITYKEDKPSVMEKFIEMKRDGGYPHDLWK